MVSAGRVCCITAPFLLSIAVLVCLVLVFLAGTHDRNNTLDDLYFLKVSICPVLASVHEARQLTYCIRNRLTCGT